MKLLAGVHYDPAAAVTKSTAALLAMTAFDTTNLRLSNITVPSHGRLRWRVVCCVHGATTIPSVLLGVMEGATVRGRLAPMVGGGNLIATGRYQLEATGLITGLTPAALVTLDAAYGVEVVVASTGIKYGGPNNTTTNDAFGGIVFEVFDPSPAAGSGSGATAQEVWEYATRALTDKAGFSLASAPPTAAQIRTEMDANSTKLANLDAAVSTRSTYAGADTAGTTTLVGRLTAPRATALDNLDAAITTRLATAGYSAPPSAASIRAEIDANSTKLDVAVSSRMATFTYTAPDNAGIASAASAAAAAAMDAAAIKVQTDKFVFHTSGHVKAEITCINGVDVTGAGVPGNLWRALGT